MDANKETDNNATPESHERASTEVDEEKTTNVEPANVSPEDILLPTYTDGQIVKIFENDGSEHFYKVVSVTIEGGSRILSMVAVEQEKVSNDVETVKSEKKDVTDSSEMGLERIIKDLEKTVVSVKEEPPPRAPLTSAPPYTPAKTAEDRSTTPPASDNYIRDRSFVSPLATIAGGTKNGRQQELTPTSIERSLHRNTSRWEPTSFVNERVVIIEWTVTQKVGGQCRVSSDVIARIFPNPPASLEASIRKGLGYIFELNLGFATSNSSSAQHVPVNVIWNIVRHPDDLILNDQLLMDRIHERIDRLVAASFVYGDALGLDYVRAARWLAGMMNARCDQLRMTGAMVAPFLMFLAVRVPAFEPATFWKNV